MVRKSGLLGRSPFLQKLLIIGLGAELVCFLGCYGFYSRMNQERDLRLFMYQEYPQILDKYYMIHEMSSSKIRDQDMYIWKTQGKIL